MMKTKMAVDKKKIAIYLLILCALGVVYWAYVNQPVVNQLKTSTNKSMTYSDNYLKEEVDGKLIWECYADTMSINQDTKVITMTNIKGTFYRDDGNSIELTAPTASYDQDKKYLTVQGDGGVYAQSTDDMQFSTDKVTWDGSQGLLTCIGNVNLAKPGLKASGDKAESTNAFKDFKLIGNAHISKEDVNQ